ncbi:MAG: N-formylglutamate amidohydrolase [Desulfobacterales bacterium]
MKIPAYSDLTADLGTHERVAGRDPLGGFAYDLDLTYPGLAVAIHAGHGVRPELRGLMTISDQARLAEEDPATDQFIRECPSALWGLDSRAEYDLNRPPESAIPLTAEMFWGLQVYRQRPDEAAIRRSLEKYQAFYRFVKSLLQVLLARHRTCVVYDIHAYNLKRQRAKGHPDPPLFNLGTRLLDRRRWRGAIERWLSELAVIPITGTPVSVMENDVFGGQGEFCRRLGQWDPNILVLPTEIAKIYMDEVSGRLYPDIVDAIRRGLARAVTRHGRRFQQPQTRPQPRRL